MKEKKNVFQINMFKIYQIKYMCTVALFASVRLSMICQLMYNVFSNMTEKTAFLYISFNF